ncbi:MAG: hypothetical protein J6J03_03855 [Tyzzerella sp.]|nr:hypothetical protein [Tyzzerella sp.]
MHENLIKREQRKMKRIKKFLRDNQWAILGALGILTWIALALEVAASVAETVGFYIFMANL